MEDDPSSWTALATTRQGTIGKGFKQHNNQQIRWTREALDW